ncbi:MAG: hypothetical protein BWY15_01563 [Firmicutes bacterium ADurb.Bin193]|nr:MAG: hypothetical protein BWY15_01563 [Firmicutes bacterium ADurb.Bin193]
MKKRISIILIAVSACLAIAIAAVASGVLPGRDKEAQLSKSVYMSYNKAPAYQADLSDHADNTIFERINRSGKTKNEIYEDIFQYKKFKKMYKPASQDMAYLDALIIKGANIATLINIYDFWLTTSEDISIIGQIYDLSSAIAGPYWIEDAFNQITGNRHGVLDKDGINQYLSQQITAEDIRIANVLSRKGVLTITEVLDRFAADRDWAAIVRHVEENGRTGRESLGGKTGLGLNGGITFKTLKDILLYVRFINIIRPQDETVFGETQKDASSMEGIISECEDEVIKEVYTDLLADGVFKDRKSKENGDNKETDNYFREKIRANGVSDEQVEALLDNGYSILDILNASEESKVSGQDITDNLKDKRNELLSKRRGAAR